MHELKFRFRWRGLWSAVATEKLELRDMHSEDCAVNMSRSWQTAR